MLCNRYSLILLITILITIRTSHHKNQQMLFNYHVKEMFRQCAFFLPKEKKPRTEKEKAPGSTVWRSHRSHRSWHRNILYTRRDWRSLGNRGGCQKGAEKHAGLQFGINVKGLAIHSRTGKKEEEKKEKNQAQETCPEIKRDCWREQDVLQKNKIIMIFYIYSCRELQD